MGGGVVVVVVVVVCGWLLDDGDADADTICASHHTIHCFFPFQNLASTFFSTPRLSS